MPEHDWPNCETCRKYVIRYGESYFNPETGWHPLPPQVTLMKSTGGIGIVGIFAATVDQPAFDNLHRLKDGEVVSCWSLN